MSGKKRYINNQVRWLKEYTDAEVKAIREAVKVVAETSTAKFEAQNEWRAQMKDQVGTFAPKESVDARINDANNKIIELQKFNSNLVGKITVGAVIWTVIVILFTWLIKK